MFVKENPDRKKKYSNDIIGLVLVVNCVIIFYYKIHATVNHKISLPETSFLKNLILEKKHKFFYMNSTLFLTLKIKTF